MGQTVPNGVVMRHVLERVIASSLLLFVSCHTSLAQTEHQSSGEREVSIESFVVSGTRAVDSAELAEITNTLSGSRFSDDAEELKERIRNEFQDRGYFKVEVEHLDIKVIDPLASPKPVRLEAEVSEGPLCRLSGIDFTGNHAFSSDVLRAMLPLKAGDVFKTSKIASGLDSIRSLLSSRGFLDSVFIPEDHLESGSSVNLNIEVQEGPQYRMGKLEVVGPPEVAEKLQTQWELVPGKIFDAGYVKTFLEENSSLLPADFTQANGVELFKDCGDATVSVHLHLTHDPQHDALDRAKPTDCDDPDDPKKDEAKK
jgi:outer membrane protein assembly factor BamA